MEHSRGLERTKLGESAVNHPNLRVASAPRPQLGQWYVT